MSTKIGYSGNDKIKWFLTGKILSLWLFFSFLISNISVHADTDNPLVSKEASLWEFQDESDYAIVYFPCSMIDCIKLGVRGEGLYKVYFKDGFVLNISPSGKVINHYYYPSPNNLPAFEKVISNYTQYKYGLDYLQVEKKKRIKNRLKDLDEFFGLQYFQTGDFKKVVNYLENLSLDVERYPIIMSNILAIKSIAYRELDKKYEFIENTNKSYNLDSKNIWARRAKSLLFIDEGEFKEALKILSLEPKENFDKVLESIVYAKLGDTEKSMDIFLQISEDYYETENVFEKKYVLMAKDLLKPYKETKLKLAKDYELKGLYKEAFKEYYFFLRFADEKEAKEVRTWLAKLMVEKPHLFVLPEEARKLVIWAETYTSEGKFEKAIEEYKKALKIQPFFPAIYKALALNYAQLKNYKQAIRNMQIYLDLYPDAPDSRAVRDEIYRWELKLEKE